MTNTQWQKLIDLLGNPSIQNNRLNGESLTSNWIIDSGASHHVTGNLALLSNVSNINESLVCLPDGTQTTSTKQGDVYLSSKLVLRNVLYVPRLNCNLISVTNLTDSVSCTLYFTKTLCVIQDQPTRTLIGAGERRDGLYYFRDISKLHALSVELISNPELWHQRLGHPSNKVVRSLPFIDSNNSILNKACGVCHPAKKHRHKFPISDSRASFPFEIIHCDLWGKYILHHHVVPLIFLLY